MCEIGTNWLAKSKVKGNMQRAETLGDIGWNVQERDRALVTGNPEESTIAHSAANSTVIQTSNLKMRCHTSIHPPGHHNMHSLQMQWSLGIRQCA